MAHAARHAAVLPACLAALLALPSAALLPGARALAAEPLPLSPAVAQGENWRAALQPPAAAKAGAPAVAQVRLTALSGHHVNLEYPTSFTPDASATVKFAGDRLALAPGEKVPCAERPAETCQVALPIAFTMGQRPAALSGVVAFSVCTAERCHIHKVRLGSLMR